MPSTEVVVAIVPPVKRRMQLQSSRVADATDRDSGTEVTGGKRAKHTSALNLAKHRPGVTAEVSVCGTVWNKHSMRGTVCGVGGRNQGKLVGVYGFVCVCMSMADFSVCGTVWNILCVLYASCKVLTLRRSVPSSN